MISVLIPIYNFDCTLLLQSLAMQAKRLGKEYEIIAFEDGSTSFLKENALASKLNNIKYSQRRNNVGRSAIRNILAKEARFDYLIFLDCDVTPAEDDFLLTYIQHIQQSKNVDILYGGRAVINEDNVKPERKLNWLTCSFRETHKHFLSNNFLIRKEIFNNMSFNEELKGYGHEDTLFALDATDLGYDISYIDNPVCCQHLERNEDFLAKARASLKNISWIIDHYKRAERIRIVSRYDSLKSLKIDKAIAIVFISNREKLEKRIIKKPSLYLFDLYKLGYLCMLRNK